MSKMTEEQDNQPKSQKEQPEGYPLPSETHCDFLRRLWVKGEEGIKKWNKWRQENPSKQVFLVGCDLNGSELAGVNLKYANLAGAQLWNANLRNADLMRANLQGAGLMISDLTSARLGGINSERASFEESNLHAANLGEANLKKAKLVRTNLSDANLFLTDLQDAKLLEADLRGTHLIRANLRGSDFSRAHVDGGTLIWDCDIDCNTKFEGVGLGNVRIYPKTRELLEYNIRRMNWSEWYRGESKNKLVIGGRLLLTIPIRAFLWVSNYGLSTGRIALTFFGLAFLFALLYYFIPGLVHDLHITGNQVSDFIRACYFSIVTMTTLGFGDMYAEPGSKAGHILLIIQVLFGYILLAALVTRFAVLFTAGGPATKFTKKRKEKRVET
jgi:uncharacterized protein YjbI with pentapeptide repeats